MNARLQPPKHRLIILETTIDVVGSGNQERMASGYASTFISAS